MNPAFRNLLTTATDEALATLKGRADVQNWVKMTQQFAQVTTGQSFDTAAIHHQVALAAVAAEADERLRRVAQRWSKALEAPAEHR